MLTKDDQVSTDRRGISWSTSSFEKRAHFGVLIKRNIEGAFSGTFKLTSIDNSSRRFRSPTSRKRRDEAEPVLFDPSTKAIGESIDAAELHANSSRILSSLHKLPQIDGAEPTHELSWSTIEDESSQMGTINQSGLATPVLNGNLAQPQDQAKVKNLMMYHHKQRHIHKPHLGLKTRARSPSGHDHESDPLRADDAEEDVWTDPVRYITTHEMGFNFFGRRITRTGVRCIRSIKMKLVVTEDSGETQEYEATGHWSMMGMLIHKKKYHDEVKEGGQDRYLVVGRLSTNGYVIKEKILRYREHDEADMLRKLHKGVRAIRGMRGVFSLKSLSGFSLYQVSIL